MYQVVAEFKIPLKAGPVKWMKNHQSVIEKKTLKQRGVSPLWQGTTLSCPTERNWNKYNLQNKHYTNKSISIFTTKLIPFGHAILSV